MKPPQASRHPLGSLVRPLRVSRQNLSAQQLSAMTTRMLSYGFWKRRSISLTTRAARVKKRLPACLLSLCVKLLDSVSIVRDARTVSGCFAQKRLLVLSCSNLGCVSLLFVLLSFLLLCLYVSEQTRSKLPITTSFDLSLY